MTDLRQTEEYAKFLRLEGWTVERIDGINYFIKKLPLLGNIIKIQRPEEIRYKEIKRLSEKYRTFQIIIEPISEANRLQLTDYGFKLSKSPYLPSKTLQIDLTQTQTAIYTSLKRNIRKGIKIGEGLTLKEYSTPLELETFRQAWRKAVNFKRYVPSLNTLINLRRSFPGHLSLFLASHNNNMQIIGGVIFTIASHGKKNETTYYDWGFTSREGRASLVHAHLLYSGILWAKKQGCWLFDFEGIYDERFPNKSWLGFTQFKKSFGGRQVPYPGCYIKTNWGSIFPHFR